MAAGVAVAAGCGAGVGDFGVCTGVGLGADTGLGSGLDFCTGFTGLVFTSGSDLGVAITGAERVTKADCNVTGITISSGGLSDISFCMAQIRPACADNTSSPIQTMRLASEA